MTMLLALVIPQQRGSTLSFPSTAVLESWSTITVLLYRTASIGNPIFFKRYRNAIVLLALVSLGRNDYAAVSFTLSAETPVLV
jgi:hypothetical protein